MKRYAAVLGLIVGLVSAPSLALFEDIETCDEVYSLDLAGFLYKQKIREAYSKAIEPITRQRQIAFKLGAARGGLAGAGAAAAPYQTQIDVLINYRDNELKQLEYRLEQLHYHNQHCFE